MALTFAARAEGREINAYHRPARPSGGVKRWRRRASGPRGMTALRRLFAARTRGASGLPTACPTFSRCLPRSPRRSPMACMAAVGPAPGETFWQFRQYQASDSAPSHRLAALGQLRPSLCARARVGGGAHLLAVARPLALDAFPAATSAPTSKRDRALVLTLAAAELLVRGGERVGANGTDAADGQPQGRDPHRRNAWPPTSDAPS